MGLVVALSETTTSLLAALLGAIVGGIATLGGSLLVNRWDRAMDARLRMYEQLIPQAKSLHAEYQSLKSEDNQSVSQMLRQSQCQEELAECYEAIRRACVVAGRRERRWRNATVGVEAIEPKVADWLDLLEQILARRIR